MIDYPYRTLRHPHYVTQREEPARADLFEDCDHALYLDLLDDMARREGVVIWSCCLMPNHAHVIAVRSAVDGLRRTFPYLHPHLAGFFNVRLHATWHLSLQ